MKKQFHRLGCVLRRLACELPVIFNWRILVGIAFFCALTARTTVEASSAVAVAVNSKGELGYGYYYDSEITEAEAQRRAIKQCLIWGGRKTRIIASTSKLGYGAVISVFKIGQNAQLYSQFSGHDVESSSRPSQKAGEEFRGNHLYARSGME